MSESAVPNLTYLTLSSYIYLRIALRFRYVDRLVEHMITISYPELIIMPVSTSDRQALTARSIPHMTLSSGDASSMTGPPPPMPHYLNAEGRAIRRFAVEGVAIRTSAVP